MIYKTLIITLIYICKHFYYHSFNIVKRILPLENYRFRFSVRMMRGLCYKIVLFRSPFNHNKFHSGKCILIEFQSRRRRFYAELRRLMGPKNKCALIRAQKRPTQRKICKNAGCMYCVQRCNLIWGEKYSFATGIALIIPYRQGLNGNASVCPIKPPVNV